jgi:hypothetical protein
MALTLGNLPGPRHKTGINEKGKPGNNQNIIKFYHNFPPDCFSNSYFILMTTLKFKPSALK